MPQHTANITTALMSAAQIEELPDPALGEVPDGPLDETPVLPVQGGQDGVPDAEHPGCFQVDGSCYVPVGGPVVVAAEEVVRHPGRVGC